MNSNCDVVIISDKAYNAIIRESFAKHPVETGGVLLGYILDNGVWVVMEMIPPGINAIFQPAYFEYDQDFVNYLGTSVANQYKEPLQVLGLWHRHPGSMDYFSSTDDGTNQDFASRNPYGTISGLVNIDPKFRLTMYHLSHAQGERTRNVAYKTVEVEIGDDLIPERFFRLRYVDGENADLNPIPARNLQSVVRDIPTASHHDGQDESGEQVPPASEIKGKNNRTNVFFSKESMRSILAGLLLIGIGMGIGFGFGRWTRTEVTEQPEPITNRIQNSFTTPTPSTPAPQKPKTKVEAAMDSIADGGSDNDTIRNTNFK